MVEKYYRVPITNAVIKLSAVEYITPIVTFPAGKTAFRIVYNNYTTVPTRAAQIQFGNSVPDPNLLGPAGANGADNYESGYNGTVYSANAELLTSIRNDLINTLTDNGVNLINNFPDL